MTDSNNDTHLKTIEEQLLSLSLGQSLNIETINQAIKSMISLTSEEQDVINDVEAFIFTGSNWSEEDRLDLMNQISVLLGDVTPMLCRCCGQPDESGHCDDCYNKGL